MTKPNLTLTALQIIFQPLPRCVVQNRLCDSPSLLGSLESHTGQELNYVHDRGCVVSFGKERPDSRPALRVLRFHHVARLPVWDSGPSRILAIVASPACPRLGNMTVLLDDR